tara:strand:- start:5481 stop:6029 length:549 start_codon:yes stop_codon:yes gene_type:complete
LSKQLVGNAVYIEKLGVTFHQKGPTRTYCHQNHDTNFVHTSLKQALTGAMIKAIDQLNEPPKFIPVAFGRINNTYYGIIGMLRFYEDQFEFSSFSPYDYDEKSFERFRENPELKIIYSLNSILHSRPHAPYLRDMNIIPFNGELDFDEAFDLALSTLLYSLSFHLSKQEEAELQLILNDNTI